MIKSEIGKVQVMGSGVVISVEFSMIVAALKENFGEDFVNRAFSTGMKTAEEIKAENREMGADLEKLLGVNVDKMVEEIKNAILKKEGK